MYASRVRGCVRSPPRTGYSDRVDARSNNAPHVVIEVDDVLRVTGWNRRAEQVFGVGAGDAVGRPLGELAPVTGEPEAWSAALVADSEAPEVRIVARGDGELMFEAWSQVLRDDDGRTIGAVIYGHDATTRTATQRRASLEAALLAALINNLDITVWAIDRDGRYLYQDGKGLHYSGLQPHQLVGQNLFEVFGDYSGTVAIRRALAGETCPPEEVEVFGARWLNWFIPVENKGAAAVVGVGLDITDTRRNEAELRAKLDLIEKQQEVIRELSTPIIEVWEGVLCLPVVGVLDTTRSAEMTESLLTAIVETRASCAIIDITGIQVMDTGTADHFLRMARAVRLLGANCLLTGINPAIAQTIIHMGVDLSGVVTHRTMRNALQRYVQRFLDDREDELNDR